MHVYNEVTDKHMDNEIGDKHVYNVIAAPLTSRSSRSVDMTTSTLSYRAPSSIHLRDSIDNALQLEGITIRTPDILSESEDGMSDGHHVTKRQHSHNSNSPVHPYCSFSFSDPQRRDDDNPSYQRCSSCDRQSIRTAASLHDTSRSMEYLNESYHNSDTLPIRSRYSYYNMSGSLLSESGREILMSGTQSLNNSFNCFSMDSHLDHMGRTIFQDLISDINRMCRGLSSMSPEVEQLAL